VVALGRERGVGLHGIDFAVAAKALIRRRRVGKDIRGRGSLESFLMNIRTRCAQPGSEFMIRLPSALIAAIRIAAREIIIWRSVVSRGSVGRRVVRGERLSHAVQTGCRNHVPRKLLSSAGQRR